MSTVTVTPAMHQAIADEAKARIEALQCELAETTSVEAYHRRLAGRGGSVPASNGAPPPKVANPYSKMMQHEAVAAAIKKLGPSELTAIVDEFITAGYMTGKKRAQIYNATYRAATRKTDWFKQDGTTFSLTEEGKK